MLHFEASGNPMRNIIAWSTIMRHKLKNSANLKRQSLSGANHFEIKRRIFGEGEILGRDVLQTDLTEEDMERLRDGFVQVLPERDVAGRTVICLNLGFRRQDSLASPLVSSWCRGLFGGT